MKYTKEPEYEIIVVDNRSTDGSREMLQSVYGDRIRLLENPVNGCSSGRNLGIRHALGELICFLDSDQEAVRENWLVKATGILRSHPEIGAVGWAGGWLKKDGTEGPIYDDIAELYDDESVPFSSSITYLGTGGMLVKKEAVLAAGGFNEAYDPAFFEDTDFSLRLRRAGYELALCPGIGLHHTPHQTTGQMDALKLMSEKREVFRKNWGGENQKYIKYAVDDPGKILVINYYNPFNSCGGQRPLQLIREGIRYGSEVTVVFESASDMENMRDFPLFFHPSLRLLRHDAATGKLLPVNEQAEDMVTEQALLTGWQPDAVLSFVPVPELFDLFRRSHEAGILTIYDQMDKWAAFSGTSFGAAEADYVETADIHTTITKLLAKEDLLRYGKHFLYFPNAVSEDFSEKTGLSFRKVQERNAASRKKILYAGALWPAWFDWKLLEYVIKSCPDYDFIIIGGEIAAPEELANYESGETILRCHKLPNAQFTGALRHDRLPEYYKSANVAIIPFISNDITKPCSPLKYYEYVSAFLPVVTTEIEDLKDAPLVRMALGGTDLKERFVSLLREAAEHTMTEEEYWEVRDFVGWNRWDVRYEVLRAAIFPGRRGIPVPVLAYHGVREVPFWDPVYFVRTSELEKQLQQLLASGFTPVTFEDLPEIGKIQKPVMLTFDDGYIDNYEYLFPLLKKYHVKVTLFMIAGKIGEEGYLSPSQLREMSDSGLVSVQSHTMTHDRLDQMKEDHLETELTESAKRIAELTKKKPIALAYPMGKCSPEVLRVVKNHYFYGLGFNPDEKMCWMTGNGNYTIPRLFVWRDMTARELLDAVSAMVSARGQTTGTH